MTLILFKMMLAGIGMAMADDTNGNAMTFTSEDGEAHVVALAEEGDGAWVGAPMTWTSEDGQITMMTIAGDEGDGSRMAEFVFEIAGDDADGGAPCWAQATANADGAWEDAAPQIFFARTISNDDEDATDGEHEVIMLAGGPQDHLIEFAPMMAAGIPEGSAWLGVTVEMVPPSLDAQLNLNGKGAIINNVVTDSPAAAAGLKQWDVVLSIDNQSVGSEPGAVAKAVSDKEPGARVNLTVLRGGSEINFTATLGSAPNPKDVKWEYAVTPDMGLHQSFRNRIRGLKMNPDGQWDVKELKDLAELKDLPDAVKKFMPGSQGVNTSITIENDHRNLNIAVDSGGQKTEIEQEGEGPITVRRTGADDNTSEQVFDNADALKNGDEEAYELYSQAQEGNAVAITINGDDTAVEDGGLFNGALLNLHGLDDASREEIRNSIEEARKSVDEAMKDGGHTMRLQGMGPHGKAFNFRMGHPGSGGPGQVITLGGPLQQSFKVMPDGAIEARYQKDGTELVEVYKDENDLASRNPDLFKKFDEINSEVR